MKKTVIAVLERAPTITAALSFCDISFIFSSTVLGCVRRRSQQYLGELLQPQLTSSSITSCTGSVRDRFLVMAHLFSLPQSRQEPESLSRFIWVGFARPYTFAEGRILEIFFAGARPPSVLRRPRPYFTRKTAHIAFESCPCLTR